VPREWTIEVPDGWAEDPALTAKIVGEKQAQVPGAHVDAAAYRASHPKIGDAGGALVVTQTVVELPASAMAELERGAHEANLRLGSAQEYSAATVGDQLIAEDFEDGPMGAIHAKRILASDGAGHITWVNAQCVGRSPACAAAVKSLALRADGGDSPWAYRVGLIGGGAIVVLIAVAVALRIRAR
jgi:hypothetical protein